MPERTKHQISREHPEQKKSVLLIKIHRKYAYDFNAKQREVAYKNNMRTFYAYGILIYKIWYKPQST